MDLVDFDWHAIKLQFGWEKHEIPTHLMNLIRLDYSRKMLIKNLKEMLKLLPSWSNYEKRRTRCTETF
jgi:hypothetical protein